jgi:hypothetical protein
VNARASGTVAALAGCAIVLAQLVYPGLALFHTWQYALALAIVAWLLISSGTRSGRSFFTLALFGALVVVADGIASGLFGPDTASFARAPGTITPLADLGAAAFFSPADTQTIAAGTGSIVLRRPNQPELVIPSGGRTLLGATMLVAQPMSAAYIEAFDAQGNHLTVTQPTGNSFLSPILLFPERQTLAGSVHPVDGFALPGAKRAVKVVYFAPSEATKLHVPVAPENAGKPALLYDVFDESSTHSLGIGIAPTGVLTQIGGVRLRATLGRYPQLLVASAPQPYALIFGLGLFVLGLAVSILKPDHGAVRESERHEEEHRDGEHRVRPRSQES